MIYPKIPLAQSLIEIFKAKGIHHIVISPGSRNAPLTLGFSNQQNVFKCFSIADERCAGFFALGMAQQLNQPVALVCTSGSALLNYYPAVAEAFYSQIPLIVVSADRPQNKIDIGDGQTIRQENVFTNHCLYNANLTEYASNDNDIKINVAIHEAIVKKGPTHINVPFEEPLYDLVTELSVAPKLLTYENEVHDFTVEEKFIQQWNLAKKKLILVGELKPNAIENSIIDVLAKDNSVVVLTEKTSNLHHDTFIDTIDTLITPFTHEDFKNFQPEILITFGGMVVSKRIKAFLRKYKPQQHWHIDTLRAYDTYGSLTEHFKTHPNNFFTQLLNGRFSVDSAYKKVYSEIIQHRKEKHTKYVNEIPFSDFKVFEFVSQNLPKDIQLQVSNSSAIRYLQLVTIDKSIEVFCNRGTSGIDGSTSTAIGAALKSNKPTIFITGDVSFFYDSNALWNNYIPKNFKIILINNSGGGIFRILPGHQETEVFNTFFETTHDLNASHLAKMYGFNYFEASDEKNLEDGWQSFINQNDKPSIFEIFTPEKINNKILINYFKS
ncbi:2-succinyl-5-enolpyruvyl-6-hydroxy-3-cyclohexene-1-carboxylic-acid synthase [uncultured Flavobacterium sp.]|uniref:2-succinyl-5-enolpyruvyl-6-hydroxy-3- cyclohexene-1-carboxylic-acid synthase n=1 Tax=uncultured Flavobacterium sp. TaxID=165435 RepID=UPI0030C7BFB1